eukprot:CAMPEP_0177598714 /NCGR_PEP_ID=MMETSP0419_2-20121207/12533_1 /TAXON_ID=582737 /ORGANISM="Tetraselmis sp., Strain GSL018" /LENGTH=553 /DNA_ID=CAMNT_0019091251 /DNA_START=2688 /DNA_END=4349 /DNA_ORIENTATION=+
MTAAVCHGDRLALFCKDASKAFEVSFRGSSSGSSAPAAGELRPRRAAERELAGPSNPTRWPVLLVMVGQPGSGKSTFAEALLAACHGQWRRVCQDCISAKGTPGTRKQCVAATRRALSAGTSVVLDRCNVDPKQRAEFVALAKQLGLPSYSVVLQHPESVCVKRAVQRTTHEAGVLGKEAVRVSGFFRGALRRKGAMPNAALEGLAGVRVCRRDADVDEALKHWVRWTRAHAPAVGSGRATGPATVQVQDGSEAKAGASGQKSDGAPKEERAVKSRGGAAAEGKAPAGEPPPSEQRPDAFSVLMDRSKRPRPPTGKRSRSDPAALGGGSGAPRPAEAKGEGARLIHFRGAWSQRLRDIARDPARFATEYPELRVLRGRSDAEGSCVLIHDKYPKARRHALFISTNSELESVEDLRPRHIEELLHMHRRGAEWARQQEADVPLRFRLGFHTVPSMRQLHLHVVSEDFDSHFMKHKKHWNSFTTAFFRPITDVIDELRTNGSVRIDLEEVARLLSSPVRCFRCLQEFKTVPDAKLHVRTCAASALETLTSAEGSG